MSKRILNLGLTMSATLQVSPPPAVNRRRRVRQKIHAPAYASLTGDSTSEMLDLCEVLDISEVGVAIQSPSQMEADRQVDLSLDLAEADEAISVTARVVWSDAAGRTGFALPVLPPSTLHRLREWLFLNSMAGAANAASSTSLAFPSREPAVVRPDYSDTLAAVAAVQREAESLEDLESVLALLAGRSRSLLRASGAAIALAEEDAASNSGAVISGIVISGTMTPEKTISGTTISGRMTCRASAGQSAPPVGAVLQVGSGFSGECVRTGETLRCDDTETDERADRQSCRALGIRSMVACPLSRSGKVIGLLEVFSAAPRAFGAKDSAVLQRLAETTLAAVIRAEPSGDKAVSQLSSPKPFVPAPGSVLFAYEPENRSEQAAPTDRDKIGGIHLPRLYLYFLIIAAATIALSLGFIFAPWIQEKIQGNQARSGNDEPKVLASSRSPVESSQSASPISSASSNLQELRQQAQQGDPVAENALGLLYAQGDEKHAIHPDESEAARWFAKAAEDGSVPAQYKLALLSWGGHGVPKDAGKAYFWAVLARAGGQEGSKDLAKVLANGMSRAQTAAIEQQAEIWYQQHESHAKPEPGH